MSSKQSKTTVGHQKKSQKSDRYEETGEGANRLTSDEQTSGAAGILEAITALKDDFGSKFDGVLTAINGIKSDFKDFSGRLQQAENRIGDIEDEVASEKIKLAQMEKQVSELISKVDDLENRSRRSNLRLINLPEKVEKGNAAAFLEKWLPDVLGPEVFPAPLVIESAHRLPRAPQSSAPPVMIIKFLNFRDKIRVMQATRKKGRIMYEGHHVMFFQDISTELHKKRKRFDGVKQQLRDLKIDYGIIYPAKLRLLHGGKPRVFTDPASVESFIKELQQPGQDSGDHRD